MVKIYLETDEICTEYEVDLASSVLKFKAEIEALQGLEEDLRWLEFEGEILRDESRDLESYSINEGSVVHAGAPRYQPEICGEIGGGGGPGWSVDRTRSKEGRALHDWDGNMKHPKIAGLPLRRGMSVLVTDTRESEAWCRVRSNKTDVYLPRQFVMFEPAGELPSSGPVPSLPPFEFPLAKHREFRMSLGERGHSYVKITLSYTALAPPGQFTTVNVSMDCVTASERIISSVSFMVTSPGQTVREVKCPQLSGPQQSVHVEVTKRETSERHGELHFAVPQVPVSFDAGISQESEQTRIESGTRESQISINGFRHSQDTAHWTLEAARGIGSERDSVPKTLRDLSFTLEEKPAVFHFECFVTTTRGGKKADRWAGSLGALNKGKRLFGLISIM